MSDVGLNISKIRILLSILRNKLGVKMFEPEKMMKSLRGDMIFPKFEENNYYYEAGSKPWTYSPTMGSWYCCYYKKETQLIINSSDINIYEINRMYVVVDGDHGQGVFRFSMKILYIINNCNRHESIQPVGSILCKRIMV